MRFLMYVLLLIGYSNAFNYERMLNRQGYSNQGDGYYSRYDDGFERDSYPNSNGEYDYHNNFRYSECLLISDTLLCRTITVDCYEYTSGILNYEIYFKGIKENTNNGLLEISSLISKSEFSEEYELWGYRYNIGLRSINWKRNAIEPDSYEDRVCTENAK